jgi:hypothetical protein
MGADRADSPLRRPLDAHHLIDAIGLTRYKAVSDHFSIIVIAGESSSRLQNSRFCPSSLPEVVLRPTSTPIHLTR